MTAPECRACPFPDQVAALELVRLREGIGRLASEWEGKRQFTMCTHPERFADDLRALLDDNQGER